MFGEGRGAARAPRHLAGSGPRHLVDGPSLPVASASPAHADEVPPAARVHRSRLAVALAVTLAAIPLLVVDNLPATAETNAVSVEATAPPRESSSSTARRTETTEAPATTADAPASTTTEAPATTVAPATTEAESAEIDVEALAAPAPEAPATTVAPATTAPPPPPPADEPGDPDDPETWERLAQCESGGNWSANTGNGYYGGLQFSLASWRDVGGAGYPHQASKAEQINRAKILQARYGWGQWPHCSRQLGYR